MTFSSSTHLLKKAFWSLMLNHLYLKRESRKHADNDENMTKNTTTEKDTQDNSWRIPAFPPNNSWLQQLILQSVSYELHNEGLLKRKRTDVKFWYSCKRKARSPLHKSTKFHHKLYKIRYLKSGYHDELFCQIWKETSILRFWWRLLLN